jgi:hypothetical protein
MRRRRFLQLLTFWSAAAAQWLYRTKNAMPQAMREPPAPSPAGPAAKSKTVRLIDLVTGGTVLVGSYGLRKIYVSIDDIAADQPFSFREPARNALVISAYERTESRHRHTRDTALTRAVLAKLQKLSPEDYKRMDSALSAEARMQPGNVFSFQLTIPRANRSSFPIDDLILAVFETGSSGEVAGFGWVKTAFEIAAKQNADRLIVPCLGRDWRDKRTIDFETFYKSVLNNLPPGSKPSSVCFSLYWQWPSFELEDAVKSLNTAWSAGAGKNLA